MSTSTPSKTTDITAAVAWQDIASAAQVIAADIDVSTKFGAQFFTDLGRLTGSAFTAGWPNVRIEASGKSSGNDAWAPVASYQMAVGASIAATTLNGAITAGATSLVVTSATNIAVGDLLFLGHTSDVTKYELVRVKAVSSTTITFEEACTYAHDNGCLITDQAEKWTAYIDCSGIKRLRVVVDNVGSGQGIKCRVVHNTFDSVVAA